MTRYAAIYRYAYKDFNTDSLIYLTVRCYIIRETAKSYQIKLAEATMRHDAGYELWVRKSSIQQRSYYDGENGICAIYGLKVFRQSCLACLRDCLTKRILQKNGKRS